METISSSLSSSHKKSYHFPRLCFFLAFSLVTYGFFLRKLLRERQVLWAVAAFCVLFIGLIFLAIDLRRVKKIKIWLPILILGAVLQLIIRNTPRQLMIAMRLSLFAIGFLLFSLGSYFSKVRKINWIVYFTSSGYIFATITSILFGFAVLGMNSQFPFQCEQISGRSKKIIQKSTNPFELNIFNTPENEAEAESLVDQETSSPIKEMGGQIKSAIREGLVKTQQSISFEICKATLGQLQRVYQKPIFQVGAVFAMYLLFYGVVRLVVWILTIIAYIVFLAIRLFGHYSIEKKLEEVEEVL
ncbi:hypothetical protein D8B45_00865 [Candidatus Gracilibacteria bacterium]|nr:MAG: hypothetical protein D8B45_00865 [Candidatus Gracilibacteria bacterium]